MEKKGYSKKIFIIIFIIIIFLFSVGYAVFANTLNFSEFSAVTYNPSWDIEISSINTEVIVGSASNAFKPKIVSSSSISFNANLEVPGDSLTYLVTIKNNGNIDAILRDIVVDEYASNEMSRIKYDLFGVEKNQTRLKSGEVNQVRIRIYYDNYVSDLGRESKNFNIHFIYEQDKD